MPFLSGPPAGRGVPCGRVPLPVCQCCSTTTASVRCIAPLITCATGQTRVCCSCGMQRGPAVHTEAPALPSTGL